MDRQTAHLYAFVHPAFRWWLWLQLCIVRSWMRQHRRDVYIEVTRCGSVRILIAGDPPDTYRPVLPARPHWAAPDWERSVSGRLDPIPHAAGAPSDLAAICRTGLCRAGPGIRRAPARAAPDTS
ncbi:hypothetical protein [Hyphomonas sp.]|uniref:hypothetical protein n=1 Tax=Hyphomonas sp. TaxID=87 RepID=UPI00391C4D0C